MMAPMRYWCHILKNIINDFITGSFRHDSTLEMSMCNSQICSGRIRLLWRGDSGFEPLKSDVPSHVTLNLYCTSYSNSLDLNMELPGAASSSIATAAASNEQDELSQRLARLRDTWMDRSLLFCIAFRWYHCTEHYLRCDWQIRFQHLPLWNTLSDAKYWVSCPSFVNRFIHCKISFLQSSIPYPYDSVYIYQVLGVIFGRDFDILPVSTATVRLLRPVHLILCFVKSPLLGWTGRVTGFMSHMTTPLLIVNNLDISL